MGRGRAKAKQTKVARDLKYRPVDTDFDSLARELRRQNGESVEEEHSVVPEQYSDLLEKYADDEYVDLDEDERHA